ncbi:MAG: transcriptional regulator NrdR [Candidatus Borkfalkiaceae bacterium]|nr:transcriptional regulator NrdR [Christensenellaceae bacterium]
MKCMFCGCPDSKVIDSRTAEDGTVIRRRRECVNCGKRFTTYETVENTPVFVVKNGGARQVFDPNKIKMGIIRACEKRPVPSAAIDKLVDDIQKKINNSLVQEISSREIGEMVCEGLKEIDEVSYIRFASVYRSFTDTTSFMQELEKMIVKKGGKK